MHAASNMIACEVEPLKIWLLFNLSFDENHRERMKNGLLWDPCGLTNYKQYLIHVTLAEETKIILYD